MAIREIAATGDKKRYTYRDYLELGDEGRYEIIEGDLYLTPSPGFKHQNVVRKLARLLADWVESRDLGVVITAPFDVVLQEETILQPDILYLARENYHRLTDSCLKGPPDLVVEVISPASARQDRIKKSRLYQQHGVKEYWLVEPEAATVEIFTNAQDCWHLTGAFGKEEVLSSHLLPGLEIDLNTIFTYPPGLEL